MASERLGKLVHLAAKPGDLNLNPETHALPTKST